MNPAKSKSVQCEISTMQPEKEEAACLRQEITKVEIKKQEIACYNLVILCVQDQAKESKDLSTVTLPNVTIVSTNLGQLQVNNLLPNPSIDYFFNNFLSYPLPLNVSLTKGIIKYLF